MITAIFNNKMDSTIAYGLWQWDYGQVLRIKGIDFSQFAIEIHFSFNEDDEDSTIAVGVVKEVEYESTILDDGETKVTSETIQVLDVTIPKDFLWNRNKKNYTIYVFLHLSNEEIGHTVKKILLPVKIKARPTYPHASEDEALFHSTLEQINELAETTVENAKMAKSYAVGDTGTREGEDTDNAKYYAEQASVSLEEATLQAENAEQSANNAKEYEENAELSANKAKEYELSSKTNADNAQGYMDWAYEYKDNAQEYSISARDYRDEAESAKNISLQASIDTGKVRDEVKDIQTDVKNIQTQINNTVDSVDDTIIEINELAEQIETNAETVATNTEITNQNKVATDEAKATAEEVLASSRQINADVLEIKNQIIGFVDDATRIVDEGIAEHDTSSTAHDDIRQLIVGLNDRLNTVLNSDDETLDQLSEIVDYIKDNRDLIDTITTSKVNVNDIIDNLTTMSSNKPLSAKQGKILKDLIDAIVIPTKVSAFENDKGYLTEHQSLEEYVKNTDYATTDKGGVIKTDMDKGLMTLSDGTICIAPAMNTQIKKGTLANKAVVPVFQHYATFYGLAKAAGDTTQSASDNAIGTYTDEAKTKIKSMIGVPTKTSDLTNDSGYLTEQVQTNWTEEDSTNASFIQNKPNIASGTGNGSVIVGGISGTYANQATNNYSYAEGVNTISKGVSAHAEGSDTTSSGMASHSEGYMTSASGRDAHSEGMLCQANANNSHAEGYGTIAFAPSQHAQGKYNIKDSTGKYAHIVGNGTADDNRSNAHTLDWSGNAWYAGTVTADGTPTNDNDLVSKKWVEDKGYLAEQAQSNWAETDSTSASYVQNKPNIASGTGNRSVIEGSITGANTNEASGGYSHAEGTNTKAQGDNSHAEGGNTIASGNYSHAEGADTTASGYFAHAEGSIAVASGPISHAEGSNTIASAKAQHVQGKFNIEDSLGKYAHIVGNGNYSTRSNAHTLDWYGNAWYQGKVTAEGTPTESNDLVPKSYVDDKLSKAFVEKSTSGTTVTFDDSAEMPMKSVVVGIEPVQDLHGYDSPWIGGSGKNLWHQNLKNGNVIIDGLIVGQTYTVSAKRMEDVATYCYVRKKGVVDADFTTIGMIIKNNTVTPYTFTVEEDTEYALWCNATSYENVIELQIEEGSTASEWTPYENICPITGHTGMTVVDCGVNIWDEEWELGSYSTTDGSPITYTDRIRSKNRIDVVPNTKYFFRTSNNLRAGVMYFYDVNDVFITAGTARGNKVTITPNNCRYMRIAMGLQYGNTYNHDISINYPSTDMEYHPYKGSTVSVNWESEAGTVYGGTIDVVSGLLTVDRKLVTVNAVSTVSTSYIKSDACDGYALDNDIYPRVSRTEQTTQYCDKLKFTTDNIFTAVGCPNQFAINQNQIHLNIANGLLGITDYTQETADTARAKMNAYLAENPVTVTVSIEPITYQLSPNEIRSILGYNLVYSDVGDVDVTYLADIKTYVNDTLTDYVKNTDYATADKGGVIKVPVYTNGYRGGMATIDGTLYSIGASIADIKLGIDLTKPLSAQNSTATTFYGLARASGDTTQSVSDNAIGNYTDEAKASIQEMLDVPSTEQLEDYTTLDTFYDDVIDNTASGNNIVSFNDGANNLPIQNLTINIEPNQDLHGYDSPWPSGGGINMLDISTCTEGKRLDNVGNLVNGASYATSDWILVEPNTDYCIRNAISASSGYAFCFYDSDKIFLRYAVLSGTSPINGVRNSGENAAYARVTVVLASIENSMVAKSSSIIDFSPYSNICPITGRSEANVVACGKNLFGGDAWFGCGGTDDRENRTVSGYNASNLPYLALGMIGKYKPNTRYTLILTMTSTATNGRPGFQFIYTDGTYSVMSVSGLDTTKKTFAIVSAANKTLLRIDRASYSGLKTYYVDECGLFEGVLTADDFEEYHGTPVTINFGQTVYGGTVDVLNGKLTVDKIAFVLDGTTHYVSIGGGINNNGYATAYGVIGRTTGLSDLPVGKYNAYLYATDKYPTTHDGGQNASAEGVYCGPGNPYIRVAVSQDKIADTSTTQSITDGINAWLVNNPVQICYVVETPIEIQLDSHTLSTLLGYNNIYTDINSNISITYKANTKAYIDNKVMDNVPDLTSYVKNTNYATTTVGGAIKVSGTYGSGIDSNGILYIYKASDAEVKAGTNSYKPITPNSQHGSVFYGLAKASGDTTQASSANAIGVYTNDAKAKIKTMLDIPTKTSELTNDSNFINTSYQIYATDDDNGNVTIHFGIPS